MIQKLSPRPVIYVLAGVNGAGKSSIGGHLLTRSGLTWFNPDQFARELLAATGCDQTAANAAAWGEGMRRLDEAVSARRSFAFETTLGGHSVAARLKAAARTHDVLVWFCGLASPELHIARVQARVAAGGHAIPETKIRERVKRLSADDFEGRRIGPTQGQLIRPEPFGDHNVSDSDVR